MMDIDNSHGMQSVNESRLVLHHVMHVNHSNESHCYHPQQTPQMHQYRDIQHFHLHDFDI
jgi:hypothetical protein